MKYATVDRLGAATGLYDTIDTAPPGAIQITDGQWQDWLTNPQTHRVVNGTLTTVAAPMSPEQVLGQKLGLGLAVASTGTSQINATYALDDVTLSQVGSVARDAASGLGLPGGQASFSYPDAM